MPTRRMFAVVDSKPRAPAKSIERQVYCPNLMVEISGRRSDDPARLPQETAACTYQSHLLLQQVTIVDFVGIEQHRAPPEWLIRGPRAKGAPRVPSRAGRSPLCEALSQVNLRLVQEKSSVAPTSFEYALFRKFKWGVRLTRSSILLLGGQSKRRAALLSHKRERHAIWTNEEMGPFSMSSLAYSASPSKNGRSADLRLDACINGPFRRCN